MEVFTNHHCTLYLPKSQVLNHKWSLSTLVNDFIKYEQCVAADNNYKLHMWTRDNSLQFKISIKCYNVVVKYLVLHHCWCKFFVYNIFPSQSSIFASSRLLIFSLITWLDESWSFERPRQRDRCWPYLYFRSSGLPHLILKTSLCIV